MTEQIIYRAKFNPVLKKYIFILVLFYLFVSIIGIPLIPFWLAGFGAWATRRYFDHLECLLTEKNLHFKKGYIFRVEKTIPLDVIQDITLKEGPLLRRLALAKLEIVNAGSSGEIQGNLSLLGIIDIAGFRNRVLEQRDQLVAAPKSGKVANGNVERLLQEILGILKRFEKRL